MSKLERTVYAGQIFRHFKGKLYQVVTVATHSETDEKLVIYQQLYGQYKVYARPYDMFVSEVDHEKYPDVLQKYRFELVNMNMEERQELSGQDKPDDKDGQSPDELSHKDELPSMVQDSEDRKVSFSWSSQNLHTPVAEAAGNEGVNPLLLLFLDAETYEEKRRILLSIKGEITDRLIDDIAVSMDVTVDKGELDERFASLLACVDTMAKFEVDRLR